MELWQSGSFVTSYLPAVLKSRMTGLLGMFQKVYSLAAQSFRTREKGVFNRASSSFWQAFGQLGRAVENLAVRSRQCETGWVDIRVFLCLWRIYFVTYRLLGTGVCPFRFALCVRRFHGRKKTGSDMTLPVIRRLRLCSAFRCIHWFERETSGLALPALSSGCFLVNSLGNPCWKRSMGFWLRLLC